MDKHSSPETLEEFEDLYSRRADMVYRICYMHLKNRQDAEDTTQTVFLKYLRKPVSFRDLEHEKAWFIVTSRNCSRDVLRSFWRSRRVDINSVEDAPYWDNADSKEAMNSILSLPHKYKIVMYMYYYEGYDSKDIASMLNRNESTVRTQLSKGRQLLKVMLTDDAFPQFE